MSQRASNGLKNHTLGSSAQHQHFWEIRICARGLRDVMATLVGFGTRSRASVMDSSARDRLPACVSLASY